jgi:hypothetical protein
MIHPTAFEITCIHHTDAERTEAFKHCPVCAQAELAKARDAQATWQSNCQAANKLELDQRLQYQELKKQYDVMGAAISEVIALGKECTVGITGCPDDAGDITSFADAMGAIRESLRLGYLRNDEANKLRLKLSSVLTVPALIKALQHVMRECDNTTPAQQAFKKLLQALHDQSK